MINKPKDPIDNNYKKYINEELYPSVRNHDDINSDIINIIDVQGDRNCLYWAIALFIFRTEDVHLRIRREIYEEAVRRSANYPDITLNSENGPMNILDYISNINNEGFYGGELEISIDLNYIILI